MATKKKVEAEPKSKTVIIQKKDYVSGDVKYRCDFASYKEYDAYKGKKA